ncbi:MAG: hydroxyacid dehydrogenase [Sphingobacteriales bacterium]|jgi:D-3-phosphoglycerate dehydrogenase|nr:MAG: hydroxyacid dehydrogenase [Sphingobacteriales bacterium]
MLKALITDNIHEYLEDKLKEFGFEVDVITNISKEKLVEIISQYHLIVITTYLKIDKTTIDAAKSLKVIARVGSGLENVDVAYANSKGIAVVNSPEGNANAVGEHALSMLLNVLNKISISNQAIKNNIWNREYFRGEELDGKTIGIIGFGHTGAAFAKKLAGFDVEILVNDILPNKYKTQVDIQQIQSECDVISLHVPYNKSTHHFINDSFINNCHKQPIIINTSRGAVVDTLSIIHAIETKKIKGFCVDVYEDEPIYQNKIHPIEKYHQLINNENVIATPHIAGWTVQSKYKLVKVLWDKILPIIKENC